MKHSTKAGKHRFHNHRRAKIARTLGLSALGLVSPLFLTGAAFGATWEWTQIDGRDRITITLDDPQATIQSQRNGTESIGISTGSPVESLEMVGQSPSGATMIGGLSLENGQVRLDTANSAFGFIARPAPGGVINIDVYYDPVGARWQPGGGLAPANQVVVPPPPPSVASAPAGVVTPTSPGAPSTPASVSPTVPQSPGDGTPVGPTSIPPAAALAPPVGTGSTTTGGAAAPVTTAPPSTTSLSPGPAPAETSSQIAPDGTAAAIPGAPETVSPGTSSIAPDPQLPSFSSTDDTPDQSAATSTPPTGVSGQTGPVEGSQALSAPSGTPASVQGAGTPAAVSSSGLPPEVGQIVASPGGQPSAPTAPAGQPGAPVQGPSGQISGQPGVTVQGAGQTGGQDGGPTNIVIDLGSQGGQAPIQQQQPQTSAPPAAVPGVSGNAPVNVVVVPPQAGQQGQAPQDQSFRISLNTGGPEAWPEENALSLGASAQTPPPAVAGAPSSVDVDINIPTFGAGTQGAAQQAPVGQTRLDSTPSGDINVDINATLPPGTQGAAGTSAVPGTAAPQEVNVNVTVDVQGQTGATAQSGTPDVSVPSLTPGSTDINVNTTAGSAETSVESEESDVPELEPIYMDEMGNIVPPPPDPDAMVAEMRQKMRTGPPQAILPLLEDLLRYDRPPDQREEILYNYMTALYEQHRPDFDGTADEVIRAANEAMNYDLFSPRVAEAMAVLARVNLATDNIEEAEGYINLMRQKFFDSPNVPPSYLSLGQKQMDRQDYAAATRSFQAILQDYPDSMAAKDAARLETYALFSQGHFDRALALLEFVERRWPSIYMEDPDYLALAANIRYGQGRLEDALRTYWIQYNLEPEIPRAADTLQRIAELYFRLDDPNMATRVLEELIRSFPDNPQIPLALQRLGENGIHEGELDLEGLLAIFDKPNPRLPSIYYQRILAEYPDSEAAKPAELRTIAWLYWNKEYNEAMRLARSYMLDYDGQFEAQVARDILMRSFAWELANALSEEYFERVLQLWETYPQVHEYYLPLEPNIRMALARAQLNRGLEPEALETLAPFLEDGGDPNYGFYTYQLFLGSYLRKNDWNALLTLGEKVENWNLPHADRLELDYCMALSAQQLGLYGRAMPLWKKLAPLEEIPLYQRAYANFYMARDAERRQDLRDAYQYNLDTLSMFTELHDQRSEYANTDIVRQTLAALMDVTEIAGRYAESLEWTNQYSLFIPTESEDYAGVRYREARLHLKMGDELRWRSILTTIVDSEPDSVFGKMAAEELRAKDMARDLTRFVN